MSATQTKTEKEENTHVTRVLSALAKIWVSFPVTYLIYGGFVLGLTVEDYMKLILSPFYWFCCIVAMIAAAGILRIRWYGWYLFVFSNLLVIYQTASILTYYSQAQNKLLAFLITLALQGIVLLLVGKEVRVPYFFPRIRWWETDPRYRLSVSTKIFKDDQSIVEGEIMDISIGGCFVKCHSYFAQDEEVVLEFQLFDKLIQCNGTVVWKTESRVTHPRGIGIKFAPLPKEVLVYMKKSCKKLQQLSRVYTQMTREKNWQEYLEREKRYQGTGRRDEG